VAGGRIVALGTRAAVVRVLPRAERVDCGGRTVLPGLIDPHLHLFAVAARHVELDCTGFRRVRDLLAAVARAAKAVPRGAWVRGGGLDDARLDRLPTAAELERAAPRNPVRLRHRSRHASVLNTRGLARLAVATRGADRATGLVAGAEALVSRAVGPLARDAIETGLVAAASELASLGLTTVADATPRTWAGLGPLRRVMARGEFPLRVVAMRPPGARPWRPWKRLVPGAVKLLVEEGPDGLRPDPAGLARRVALAAHRSDQVAVHCVGMATLVAALDAFAALPARVRARRRHRLEHVAECPPPLVPRIAALGLTVVTNPAFVYWRGDVYRAETERSRHGWLYPARSLLAAGVQLAGASDAPVVPPNPWLGMGAARARRTASGETLGTREQLVADEALALFTTGAAWALHADALGRLVPGGPADLVVVDDRWLRGRGPHHAARAWLTMANGRVVWQA